MRLLNGLNNMAIKVWAFLVCSAVTAFGADEFENAAKTIGTAGKTGASVLGTGLIWFFAVFLLVNYKNTKKQAKQRQNLLKIFIRELIYVATLLLFLMVANSLASQSMQNLQICVSILTSHTQCVIIADFS